jgi:hypothetical protein
MIVFYNFLMVVGVDILNILAFVKSYMPINLSRNIPATKKKIIVPK